MTTRDDHLRCLELLENLRALLHNPQPNEVWVAARDKAARDLNVFLNAKVGRPATWAHKIKFLESEGPAFPQGAV